MLEQSAESFWRLSSMVGQILVMARNRQLDERNIKAAIETLAELQREAEKLELPSAVGQLKRIYSHLFEDRKSIDGLEQLVNDLHLRITDELGNRFFLYLPMDRAKHLRNPLI